MQQDVIDARISPNGRLEVLSRLEVSKLLNASQGELYPLFRNSSLAVLNYGIIWTMAANCWSGTRISIFALFRRSAVSNLICATPRPAPLSTAR